MNDFLDQAATISRGMMRFRWQAMGTAWAAVVLGWVGIYILVLPEYSATAQIYADTETVLQPLMKGLALDMDLNKQVDLMARQVMSRPNLERVVSLTKLDEQGPKPIPRAVAVDHLRRDLSLTAEQPSRPDIKITNIYKLSYVNSDPGLAIRVVQSLISAFTENTLAEIRRDSERGKRFIEQQIASQKDVVAAAETDVRDFRRQHMEVLSGEGRSFFERLQAGEGAVAAVEQKIAETESRRRSLQEQFNDTPAYTRAVSEDGNLVPTPLEARLNQLRGELAQLSLKFTESHPDVIATRDRIAQVEAQLRSGHNPSPMIVNPTRQQLDLRVKEVAGELAALETSKAAAIQQLDALQQQTSTLPKIEDELARLTRETETAKENLRVLEERRRSMAISATVDQKSLDLYFRVIEPPSVSTALVLAAVWKKKIVLSTAVLFGALAGAAGLAYALHVLRPPVFNQRALYEITGLPVLGVVSRFATRSVVVRERVDISVLVVLFLLIIGAYGASLIIQYGSTFEEDSKAVPVGPVMNEDNG